MDKHIKSVMQEMLLAWMNFIILAMYAGVPVVLFFGLIAWLLMSLKIAGILLILGLGWCYFWIAVSKAIIKICKLDRIEYV